MSLDLLSVSSRVETPFIIVTIAGYTFGGFNSKSKLETTREGTTRKIVTQYPNFMESLNIVKVNGSLNTYTLTMKYQITQSDDPNLLEKVFSKAKNDRTIKLSYGDLSLSNYIYKEEEAIITTIKSRVDVNSSNITYTLNCISKALILDAGLIPFPKRVAKPSDIIKEILYNKEYNLIDIFYGMRDEYLVLQKNLIASDDRTVTIEAKTTSPIKYLNYLVNCMVSNADVNNKLIKSSRYTLTIYDDVTNEWEGPYFRITKVNTKVTIDNPDVYEINIGYPGQNNVTNFEINDNETYSILYDYSKDIKQSDFIYRIDNNGKIVNEYSPTISNSSTLMKTTETDRTWWTQMTQYPITVTVTLKGLLRPAILMTYVKLNVLFYGRSHIASGVYIITKQTDSIDGSGYKTTLNLTRISSVEENI